MKDIIITNVNYEILIISWWQYSMSPFWTVFYREKYNYIHKNPRVEQL